MCNHERSKKRHYYTKGITPLANQNYIPCHNIHVKGRETRDAAFSRPLVPRTIPSNRRRIFSPLPSPPPPPTWYVYLRGRSHLNLFEILCISHNTFQCCGSLAPLPSCCSAAICMTCAFRVHKRVPMAGETERLAYLRTTRTAVMNDCHTQ